MIRCNVQQDSYMGFEIIHIIQLKTTQFDDIIIIVASRYLQGQTFPHITGKSHFQSGTFQNMICQQCSRRFPIAPGNANHAGTSITTGKLYFRNNRNILFT